MLVTGQSNGAAAKSWGHKNRTFDRMTALDHIVCFFKKYYVQKCKLTHLNCHVQNHRCITVWFLHLKSQKPFFSEYFCAMRGAWWMILEPWNYATRIYVVCFTEKAPENLHMELSVCSVILTWTNSSLKQTAIRFCLLAKRKFPLYMYFRFIIIKVFGMTYLTLSLLTSYIYRVPHR
jgi:hypothetical protein